MVCIWCCLLSLFQHNAAEIRNFNDNAYVWPFWYRLAKLKIGKNKLTVVSCGWEQSTCISCLTLSNMFLPHLIYLNVVLKILVGFLCCHIYLVVSPIWIMHFKWKVLYFLTKLFKFLNIQIQETVEIRRCSVYIVWTMMIIKFIQPINIYVKIHCILAIDSSSTVIRDA